MSLQDQVPSTEMALAERTAGRPARPRLAARLLHRLLARLAQGRLIVETPEGEVLDRSAPLPGPHAQLTLHNWRAMRRLLLEGDLGFAEAYVAGDWSTPDLTALLEVAAGNETALGQGLRGLGALRWLARLRHLGRANTRRGSRRNIMQHYDLGNDFYAQWLDAGMSYSAGLYTSGAETLDQAQAAKQARAMVLLDPAPGQRVLEIGCGWGGQAEALIREHGVHVTGVTLSPAQLAWGRDRLTRAGLADRAELRLQDYRDLTGIYDRIISIEMLEAVGEAYWPVYFAQLRRLLAPGGVAVLQVITIADDRFEHYRSGVDFIQRHIFPGGMLPSPSALRREISSAGLLLTGSELFGASYASTLDAWRRRFECAWPAIESLGFAPGFRRLWEYYLAYCEAGFRAGALDVGFYRIEQGGAVCDRAHD